MLLGRTVHLRNYSNLVLKLLRRALVLVFIESGMKNTFHNSSKMLLVYSYIQWKFSRQKAENTNALICSFLQVLAYFRTVWSASGVTAIWKSLLISQVLSVFIPGSVAWTLYRINLNMMEWFHLPCLNTILNTRLLILRFLHVRLGWWYRRHAYASISEECHPMKNRSNFFMANYLMEAD